MNNKKITITIAAIAILLVGMIISLSVKKTEDVYTEYNGGYMLTSVSQKSETYTVLEEYNGKTVTTIGENAFADYKKLKEISIPDTVTEIQKGAFSGCSNLKDIKLPNGITQISEDTFNNCSSLSNIFIPDSVLVIEGNAFANCSSLKSVQIPENASVSDEAFTNSPANIEKKSFDDAELIANVEEINSRPLSNMYVVYNESVATDGIYTKDGVLYITDSELYSEYLTENYELLSFADIAEFTEYLKHAKDTGVENVTSFIYSEKGSQEYGKTHFITFNNTIDEIINAYSKA